MQAILNQIHPFGVALWMIGGLAGGLFILQLALPRGRAGIRGTPESRVYLWTINFLRLHLAAGIVLGVYEYIQWFTKLGMTDHFYDWWPMLLIYLACLAVDFALLRLLFTSKYRRYLQSADRLGKTGGQESW
ncbi:MAG: hypothetical protein ACE15F_00530 [bacterium]